MNYREGIQRKDWTKWTIRSIQGMSYGAFYFNGQNVSEKELKDLMADENVNFDYDDFVDYLNKNLDGNNLGKLLKNNIVFPFGVTEVGMHCDLQLEEVQTYSSSVKEGKLIIHFDLYDNITDEVWNFGCKVIFNVEIPNYNMMLEKKNLKESAKPINEKNVAKFVDELNKFCDEKIHYVDMDAENFTKKYGKLYNFKYRFDDTDEIFIVYDSEGTLDMFDNNADYVREEINRLAKKNGWYADPYTSSVNFTFGEL